jgi:hypothetical protein
MNPNKTALSAGILYLLLIPLGIFGILYVPGQIIVAGDIDRTISHLLENEMLFRLSILSALLVQLVNVFVVLLLYKLLKGLNKNAAVLMLVFFLVSVPIAFINEMNNLAILYLIHEASPAKDWISFFLEMHRNGIVLAQIFWGLWLFPMGMLLYRLSLVPKVIGVLLMIACMGYLLDSIFYLLSLNMNVEMSQFTFIGELAMIIWLIVNGAGKKLDLVTLKAK